MTLVKPPLFMQAGKYTAAADRYLVGAGLYPKGGDSMFPRPGVQPFSVTSLSDSAELSFKVVLQVGGVSGAGWVTVMMGAAYVAGPSSKILNGTYLVINDGDHDLNLALTSPGAARSVKIYLQVLDAEITVPAVPGDPQPSTLAEAVFVVQDSSVAAAPVDSLLLAEVSLNASNAVGTITDKRTYTTSHGGVLLVGGKTELEADAMKRLPLGSQAYAITDKAVFTRTPNGWDASSVLPVRDTQPQDANVGSGYQYFSPADGSVRMFYTATVSGVTTSQWYTTAQVPGKVRGPLDADYSAAHRHRNTAAGPFVYRTTTITAPDSDQYWTTEEMTAVSGGVSTANLTIRFLVSAKGTPVTAALGAEIWVKNNENTAFDNLNWGEVILVLEKYNTVGGTTSDPIDPYKYTGPNTTAWMRTGLRGLGQQEHMASRTVLYSLNPGEYRVYPRFRIEGADPPVSRVLQINAITVDVLL
jgi:hypothetical protein